MSDALSRGFSWFNRLGLFFNSDRRLRPCIRSPYGGGSGGTRTRTAVKPLDFKSNVSTCSTTLPLVSPYTTDRMQQARQSVFLRRGAVAVGRRSAHRGIGPCGRGTQGPGQCPALPPPPSKARGRAAELDRVIRQRPRGRRRQRRRFREWPTLPPPPGDNLGRRIACTRKTSFRPAKSWCPRAKHRLDILP